MKMYWTLSNDEWHCQETWWKYVPLKWSDSDTKLKEFLKSSTVLVKRKFQIAESVSAVGGIVIHSRLITIGSWLCLHNPLQLSCITERLVDQLQRRYFLARCRFFCLLEIYKLILHLPLRMVLHSCNGLCECKIEGRKYIWFMVERAS